jgi:uncharacterized protein YbjT (DUF2867 family)
MITVMGATGHTGAAVTRLLLQAGQSVRALGRSEERLEPLRKEGADVRAGDTTDATFLTSAFRGADAAYTLLPPDPRSGDYRAAQDRQGEAIANAVRESGVRYAVALSSVGADQPSGTGIIEGLHAQEARLRALAGVNVLFLRPGSFFENFHEMLGVIKQQGVAADSVAPHVPLPMIATRDIAEVAAQALLARNWKGAVVRELLGPRDLTYAEAVSILGTRIGKPDLAYLALPRANMAAALTQAGLSPSFAGLYVEMTRAFDEGRVRSAEGRKASNTTPTRFEDFAEELGRAYSTL